MNEDRLSLWEKIPLALALAAQSYVVGLWYFASIKGPHWILDLAVAIAAGLALDLIVVTTVMGRRAGRSSAWSWATAFGAFGCSALIAMDRYGWAWRSTLHIAFPLVVFLYSQHLATRSDPRYQGAPERSSSAVGARWYTRLGAQLRALWSASDDQALAQSSDPLPASSAEPSAALNGHGSALDTSSAPVAIREPVIYRCPRCTGALESKQAKAAAKTNGYCPSCKTEALAERSQR